MQDAPKSQYSADLLAFFSRKIAGQPNTAERIVPFIQTYRAGLSPENRPIGVFLLLGPTGTGKTRTVEVLAEALHGSAQRYLRIDCGEFQLDHEVAKLIGSPPGYLGHRETVPVLSKQKLTEAVTVDCDISLVLFDEIEKAAPSLTRLLLGVLDKGRLTLGDNSVVDFNKSLIFLTSNLGAREMMQEMTPAFGFHAADGPARPRTDLASKLESIAMGAVKRMFSPEFVNRIDVVLTYQPLSADSIKQILDHQIGELQEHVNGRLGTNGFTIEVADSARELLLSRGVSVQYGARELKRVVYRQLTQPLATMVAENRVPAGARVVAHADAGSETLDFDIRPAAAIRARASEEPTLLVVDDNAELLKYLKLVLQNQGWNLVTASSGNAALNLAAKNLVDLALVDYMLPDLDGLTVSKELQRLLPSVKIILMTGGGEMSVRESNGLGPDVPILQKPFVMEDLLNAVRSRLPAPGSEESSAAASGGA